MGDSYKSFESFYRGGGSSLEPSTSNSFVGYQLDPSQIGFSTNPTTGDQLGELQRGIRAGARVIEVNLLRIPIQGGGDSDQVIPEQHFAEMRALSKLTGVSPSIHGPLIDAAGFSEQRGVWSEENRENNERIMFAAMEKAKIADPDKNIPVIFHSSNMLGGGTQYKPGKKGKGRTQGFIEEITPILNRQTNQLIPVTEKTSYSLGAEDTKDKPFKERKTADEIIEFQNRESWQNELNNLAIEKIRADEVLERALGGRAGLLKAGGEDPYKGLSEEEKEKGETNLKRDTFFAKTMLDHNRESFKSLFEIAYKYGTEAQKRELKKMSDDWRVESENLKKSAESQELQIINDSKLQDNYFERLRDITGGAEKGSSSYGGSEFVAPQVFVRGEDFAMEKAAKTFGNVAFDSYQKLGKEDAPVVAIENVWNGAMFSRGKDMKKLVEKSRETMVKKLVKEGMEESVAKKVADAKIGMNFDVGHLNMFRKKGFTTEDMAAEVGEFAPYIKHMHLTDNFGFSDEHLYPGQGNVPFKEFFKEIAKKNPEFDKDVKKIVETGGVEARHMGGRSAHAFNLAAFGIPIFGSDYWAGPTFDAVLNTFGNYSISYGDVNPEIHHSIYGAGFSGLPAEVGGIVPGLGGGARSRFSETPMQ